MSIVGLGGTGKTQVALQFAYEVKEAQPEWSILWMPALSMESFEQACTEIVHALHIPQAADEKDGKELVKAWLSSGDAGRWLLVVDNADDADIFFGVGQRRGIFDYLPKSEQGIVIYTTRTMEVAVSLTQGDVLELGAMNWQDAREFLSNSLVRKALLRDTAMTDTLLDELTCLPLAITQAAAYINRNRISILKYLQLLRSTDQGLISLMSREFRDDTRYKGSSNAVATTWVVSFSQIRKHDAVAAELLAFMSCIEWKAIPRSLLPSMHSETRMEEAVGTLCGYSFLARRGSDFPEANEERDGITGADSEEWFDMHRVVHLAMRIWIKKDGHAAEVVENAVWHVARVFPSDNHANLRVWQAYLPHALRLLEAEQDCDVKRKSELCFWDDPDLLSAQHTLAVAYQGNGQVKKAVELLEVVVDVRNKVLKADDSNRLASQHALGTAYEADGQVKKAVGLLESVVKAKEMLNADNPSRLSSQHVLAMAYRADGQVKKAVELLEDIVEVRHKMLGADHPHRLASQHQLAAAYQADGQEEKAIELLESVVKTKTRILRTDHPSLLLSVEALADMHAKLAVQSDEALYSSSLESPTTASFAGSIAQQCN
ncbi:hypothetical protein ACJQWK_04653 [Exserohilum turcicum]